LSEKGEKRICKGDLQGAREHQGVHQNLFEETEKTEHPKVFIQHTTLVNVLFTAPGEKGRKGSEVESHHRREEEQRGECYFHEELGHRA